MSGIRETLKQSPLSGALFLAFKAAVRNLFRPAAGPPAEAQGPAPLAAEVHEPQTAELPTAEARAAEPAPVEPEAATPEPMPPETQPDPEPVNPFTEADLDIYKQYPPHVLYTFADKHAVFREALRAYSIVRVRDEPSGLYSDPNRVLNFFQLVSAANLLPEGDYIELGSHRGFSTRVIHKFMDPKRRLYSLDTFSGFDGRDITVERTKYESAWTEGSFGPTTPESMALYVGDGVWPENLTVIPGWFPESFVGLEDKRWRFVHIDFDLYQPIKSALELLWPRMLPGGVVMVHDYGCYGFPAVRMAVDEFCHAVGHLPIELNDRWSTAVIRKPLAGGGV